MKFIGKYGEHLIMLNLLKRDIEAYLAIKANQENYDITVVLNERCVKRIQVKSTELQSTTTNNSIDGIEKEYNYLALVIVTEEKNRVFILTKAEALSEKDGNKKLSCSRTEAGEFYIKDSLLKYEDKWEKISS